jgi:formylglycine-generating enzyme required for sulfatase activity/predicted Ser/Thr protein kinase
MLAEGTILQGRYRIVSVLGRGGMGMVYRARDANLDCDVAVKQAFFDDEHLRKAFEREAKLLRKLTHPNLPKVTDLFTVGTVQYLVMDFIAGKDLHQLLGESGGKIPLATALEWIDQALDALEYLHGQEPPVIHRDIKPANLKVTEKGKLYVLDFGLAKGFHTQASRMSAPGSLQGYTPGYAPIEQMQNAGTDARSDLYAVGATLYHLLTGTPPPDAMVRSMNLLGRQPDPLRPAHEVNPQVPRPISAALERATAMYCDGRPATAAEMRRELREAVATHQRQVKTKPAPPPVAPVVAPTPRAKSGMSAPAALATAVACLLFGGAGVAVYQNAVTPKNERPVASSNPANEKPAPSATPPTGSAPKAIKNAIGMEFVLVPAGKFQMGSPKTEAKRSSDEGPQHEVTIGAPFYLGKYEVTQGEWAAVMGNNPSYFKGDDRLPVENVSWNDCQEFITRLNARKDGYVYRLPSEAEWEYACRAGTTTPFSFGKTLTTVQANYNGNYPYGDGPQGEYRNKTTRVGSFPANAWGLCDMHGNVWEWCQDGWHENYDGAPTDGSAWEVGSDNLRVVRGGSWGDLAFNCRAANRDRFAPDGRSFSVGVRLAVRLATN